jgi:RNA polymerase sigma factor (sigma-70 family)
MSQFGGGHSTHNLGIPSIARAMPDAVSHDRLFLEFRQELGIFLRRRLDHHLAQDIAHDTFLRWRQEAGKAIRDPRAYVFTVALNLVRDAERSEAWLCGRRVAIDDIAEIPAEQATPDEICATSQRLDHLCRALEQLERPVRDAFLLHRYDGLTQMEIARRLGVSKRTVERHLQRAIERCLEALAV